MIYAILLIIITAITLISILSGNSKTEQEPEKSQPRPGGAVINQLQYFCTKDSGYYVSVWPKDQQMGDYLEFEIAGITYRDRIRNYVGEHRGTLESEPTNPYDANAIKILAPDGHHVGYVPKDMTSSIREFTTLPCPCYIYIGSYSDSEGLHFYSDCYINRPNVSPCQK